MFRYDRIRQSLCFGETAEQEEHGKHHSHIYSDAARFDTKPPFCLTYIQTTQFPDSIAAMTRSASSDCFSNRVSPARLPL
jgi:hypothetical protein